MHGRGMPPPGYLPPYGPGPGQFGPGGPMGMMGMGPGMYPPRPMGGIGMMGMGPPGMMGMGMPGRVMTPHQPPPAATAGLIAGVKRAANAAAERSMFGGGPAPAEKSTTVSVGKIAPSIDSKTIETLLEACGPLKSWKRAEDPETKVPKGFGFADYEDAEGVLRAVRLLNGLKVDGQELVIKGNSATQRYVEEYEATKKQERQKKASQRMEAAKKKQEEGEVMDDKALAESAVSGLASEEQEGDNKALEIIMGVVSEREEAAARRQGSGAPSTSNAAATEFLAQVARGDLKLPPPPATETQPSTEKGRDRDKDRGERDRDRDKDRSERDKKRDEERDKERDRDKDRERERDLERDRRKEMEREYEARLRDWERAERLRFEMREHERMRLDEAEKDRLRQCRKDLEIGDEDDDLPPWARRPYRASRRAQLRKPRRLAEEDADALDRQREQRELEAAVSERKRRRAKGDEDDELSEAAGGPPRSSHRRSGSNAKHMRGEEQSEIKPEPSEASAAPRQTSPDVDETDPIYKAMMAAATSAPRTATSTRPTAPLGIKQEGGSGGWAAAGTQLPIGAGRPGDRSLHHATHDPHAAIKYEHRNIMRSESPQPSGSAATATAASAAPPRPVAAAAPAGAQGAGRRVFGGGARGVTNVFGDEEEENKSKRVLKPIQYSEEERQVEEEIERERRAAAAAAAAPTPAPGPPMDPKAALRALMDSIPTAKAGVWAYPIKWAALSDAIKQRFRQWVDTKVAALLGAPEQSVVVFILDLISQHKGPAEAAAELEPLLDNDTETFVIKMYRTLIFETERASAGI